MEKESLIENAKSLPITDLLAVDNNQCESIAATENIMGKFWGSHHETHYFLVWEG